MNRRGQHLLLSSLQISSRLPIVSRLLPVFSKRPDFYSMPAVLQSLADRRGWQHPGEEVALDLVAPLVRSKRILDIGVGGGRTVGLLALLSDHYVGIDYSSSMVSICQSRYPGRDFRFIDARDLSVFEDCSFEFVYFSFNGIDTVDDQDRKKIYSEVHRVLTDDGIYVFSTLNKDGPSYAESPFQLHRPTEPFDSSLLAAAGVVLRNLRDPFRVARRYVNWRIAKRERVDGGGWAICALSVRDFILMNHFVTLERLREEIEEADFHAIAVIGSDSHEDASGLDVSWRHSDSFYAVLQKR
jgi:SAM-dependent methyltransferase